ncbi:MAG: hypothetical protein DYG89_44080 [Caldilinea sp. CFX5]|nr:hypothetical protein [Caldilinea sp. CFX5]
MSQSHPSQLKRWFFLLSVVLVFSVVCSSALLLMPILLAAPAAEVSAALTIVPVSAPQINCVFTADPNCVITPTDMSDTFTLPGSFGGVGRLITRQWPVGEKGTQGEGLYAYLYRIDLTGVEAGRETACVESLSIDFGPVEALDYNDDAKPEEVFDVTQGGIGVIGPAAADQTGRTVTFIFKPQLCPGNAGSNDTHYFGLASKQPPRAITAKLTGTIGFSAEPKARAPQDVVACSELQSETQIPSAARIDFDNDGLGDAAVIGAHYQASDGVTFEDSATNKAIIYDHSLHPTESTDPRSAPNYVVNDAVFPNTSAGVPLLIRFASAKTHVGLYMGNGVVGAAAQVGVLRAFDANNQEICIVRNTPVPDDITEFIGVHDPAGRIASITLDYGNTTIAEVIDDLVYAPAAPPTPTPTATPTNTPPTPTPTPTSTPIVADPIKAFPYFPLEPVIVAPFLQSDLTIAGIEITQGIQCFDTSKGLAGCADNSMPVSTKKDTTARIYLKCTSLLINCSRNNVPVRLHIFANGVEYLANAQGNARNTIDQGTLDSAEIYFNVNFSNDIPVTFYAEVDPDGVIAENNEGNNRFPAVGTINMTFRKRDTLKIVGTRLRYHPSGYTGTQQAGGWAVNGGAADWLEQLLPIRNNGINYSLSSGYLDWTGSLGSGDGQHDLIRYLNTSYVLQNVLNALFGINGAYVNADHVYGWAPNAGYSGGHADMPIYPHAGGLGVVGIGTDRTSDGSNTTDDPGGGALIFGHELVHDYDVLHTNTVDACGSSDSGSDFPYGSSSIQEYGFNPITGKIYNPATTHDLMSYCPAGGSKEGWISPFTWNKMANKLDVAVMAAASNERGNRNTLLYTTAMSQSLVVNATVYNTVTNPAKLGEIGDLYLVDTGVEMPVSGGDYAIELRNGDAVLASKSFVVNFESEYDPHGEGHSHAGHSHDAHSGGDEPGDPSPTSKVDVTFVMAWLPGTTHVVLVHNGQVLDSRAISANKPTVTVTNPAQPVEWPADSTQALTWTGSDADNDALSYTVLFSVNGGAAWSMMATELSTPTLAIDVNAMAGTDNGLFRVLATDGVNIGYGDSAPVKIPNKAPTPIISEPGENRVFLPGQLVVLQGSALDLEDGRLSEEKLNWSSDKQGVLGTGASLPTNTLQPGEHVITLSVADSQGAANSATVKILIGHELFLPLINR